MGYEAKVLADSISPAGHRLTTFEVTFPRIVLAELNTHCMLSRNSASSRAIPVQKRIAALKEEGFVPEEFGRNQKGMQPGEALSGDESVWASDSWGRAKWHAIREAEFLANLGVHKQYANRLLEPFAWHTAVVTATDLDNFFHLRVNPMAQGELRKAAELMQYCRERSEPRAVNYDDWHTPYVEQEEAFDLQATGIDPVKVSVARCGRVSYLTQNGVRDPREDEAMFDGKLLGPGHMSPLEHVARPMSKDEITFTRAFDVAFEDGPILRVRWAHVELEVGTEFVLRSGRNVKATYVRGPLNYCGKLNGWCPKRSFVYGEHDILGHRAASEK